jgi:hypothetical protein
VLHAPPPRRRPRRRARRRLSRRRRQLRLVPVALVLAAIVVLITSAFGGTAHTTRSTTTHQPQHRASRPPPPVLLPRGGRTIMPGHVVVAPYGIVGTSNILGRTGNPEADARDAERRARAFGRRALPAFELVVTRATPDPGPDGTYSEPVSSGLVARYLHAAHRHKLLLVLDFQPGQGEFKPQVLRFARFLLDPAVGVALDPEWKLAPGEAPNQRVGAASADSINAVSDYLSRVIRRHRLPQKIFIVHEFRLSELPDRERIAFHPNLATVLQMDGLGSVPLKLASYRAVARGAGRFHMGFKVFLRSSDDPVEMTPHQVMRLRPRPEYVSYQ